MAVLGTALAKELLGFDDANKAFRPWWDTTQDFLMYGMVVLGTHNRLDISCLYMINKNKMLSVFYMTVIHLCL